LTVSISYSIIGLVGVVRIINISRVGNMLTEIRLHIDDSILLSLKEEKDMFAKDMLFHHALRLYRKHKLSLGKAAELAGYTRLAFIQKLQRDFT